MLEFQVRVDDMPRIFRGLSEIVGDAKHSVLNNAA